MTIAETMQVKCPCCDTVLVVERRSGRVVEERRPILKEGATGDRFEDAVIKAKGRTEAAAAKFDRLAAERTGKAARLDSLFNDTLQRAKESGAEGEKVNPVEMD